VLLKVTEFMLPKVTEFMLPKVTEFMLPKVTDPDRYAQGAVVLSSRII